MAAPKRKRWLSTIAALVVLFPIAAVVIYSSFQVSLYECEVCITFGGAEVCRTVTAATEDEGLGSAINNACALLASGVTDSMRCARTQPTKAACRPLTAH